MKNIVIQILLCSCSLSLHAQHNMRIHYKDGSHVDVPVAQIDSLTFVDCDVVSDNAAEAGTWVWGDVEAGYYEVLTLNGDNSYTAYDNYFTYGFDTTTYGWYGWHGALLNLRSEGVGYNRRHTWYVLGLTDNALDVMTKMGRFTYYRLHPETFSVDVSGQVECAEGESFVFADGMVARIEGRRLYGVAKGTTYVLKQSGEANLIYAYKVIVE